ncbi:hypothetical protein KIN20_004386 [Parelaphostrongylus tenuis]|uniref:Uncharacterized protein n=1 Tax=Parelaphostrongylus tenuis TaxID=148309 RepID=A0AAD5QEF2_PARTN|nr:hypothetical protein KIN20_004386 [Parelaphostrongylus tenuis]
MNVDDKLLSDIRSCDDDASFHEVPVKQNQCSVRRRRMMEVDRRAPKTEETAVYENPTCEGEQIKSDSFPLTESFPSYSILRSMDMESNVEKHLEEKDELSTRLDF